MIKNILSIAVAASLSLLAVVGMADADEARQVNLGPVGPYEPILATVGEQRLLAFYERRDGKCAVSAVLSAAPGDSEGTRVTVDLDPGRLFKVDTAGNERVVFTCAPGAKAMTVLNKGEVLTRSASNELY